MRSNVISPVHMISSVVDQVGSAVEVLRMDATAWQRVDSVQPRLIQPVTAADLAQASADVHAWLAAGVDVRSVLDASYPANLHTIYNRPPLLFVAGKWDADLDRRAVAIVGTRKPSGEGLVRARKLAQELVRAGYTVLSGLAEGIDTAAHTAALLAGGRTAAVMGTGIRRVYPVSNRNLADEIVGSGGALLSQFFPDQPPTKWTFPLRNVVMSGLALATVVIEAAATSGARMQARLALEHGRAVFLPSSLVRQHEWAKQYVEEGVYGTRAIEVATPDEVTRKLESTVFDAAAV
jgi:DNA processing protein